MTRPAMDPFGDVAPVGYVRGAVDPFGEDPPFGTVARDRRSRTGMGEAVDPFDGVPPGAVGMTTTRHTPDATAPAERVQRGSVLSADKGLFGRMIDAAAGRRANVDEGMSRAKSANIMAISKAYGIDPLVAAAHYDELTEGMQDQPTPGEIAVGAGEAALNVGTGLPAMMAGGLAASRALAAGDTDKVRPAFDQVTGALTYQPRTAMGRNLSEAATAPVAALGHVGAAAGDWVYEKTDSPDLAAATATAVEGLPVLLMAKGPLTSALKVITESTPYRMATIPERGLVVQNLAETLAKNPEMKPADLVKMSDRYFAEALAERKTGEGVTVAGGSVEGTARRAPTAVAPMRVDEPMGSVEPVVSGGAVDPFGGVAPGLPGRPTSGGDLPGPTDIHPSMTKTVRGDEINLPTVKKKSTAGQNIRTLRGAIRAKGGINFQNFTGELRDMHLDVKYVAKKSGRPLDTIESELRSEGWLLPNESLLDLLMDDPTALRRGPVSQAFGDKPEREFTPQEKTISKQMNREPEEPPAGDYRPVDAQDLPVGETLTILDGKGPDGWDRYKVIEKDPFEVTLKDGVEVKLKPYDTVQVDVAGITHKLGTDGLFDGHDVQVDRVTGMAKTRWKARAASDATANDASPSLRPEPFSRDLPFDEMVTPGGENVKTSAGGTDSGAPRGFASTSGYAGDIPIVMQMPEIVELAQGVLGGKYPAVRRKLRGMAIGRFRHRGTGPGAEGHIEMEAGLFSNLDQAQKVLAHEIGHAVDWLPDKDMKRGNLLGRLASLKKYMKHQIEEAPGVGGPHISPKERAALKKEAKRLLEADGEAAVDADILETLPVTPGDVLSIFNSVETLKGVTPELLNYVKGLNTAQKKSIVKAAMKGMVPDDLQRFAAVVKGKASGAAPKKRVVTDDEIMDKFRGLFVKELRKRRLVHLSQVVDELKNVTMKWHPFDVAASERYTKYRHSSVELYADAFSAFVTNPGWLKQEAPVWFDSFVRYLENKPEVKRLYDEIQETMRFGSEALSKHRRENIGDMFRKGHEARKDLAEKNTPRVRGVIDGLLTGLVDQHYAALKQIRALEKENTPAGKRARLLRYLLEELAYIASEADVYMKRFADRVLTPLRRAGISADDLGIYIFQKRVLGDRSALANPLGHTPENVAQDLAYLVKSWGPEKTAMIEELKDAFRQIREESVFPVMRESGLFSRELMDHIEATEDYAKFSVIHYLDKAVGKGVSAKVFKQIGTLAEIENPLVPTVLQDLSVIRAARLNMVKRDMVTTLKDLGLIAPAELRYSQDVQGRVPVEPKDKWLRVMTVMDGGKARHYYVAKEITDMFDYAPVESHALIQVIKGVSRPIREILVSKNPVWMARNVVRDYLTTVKNVPEVRLRDMPKLAGYYRKAWPEVWREVFKGERSADIEEMLSLKALVKERQWSKWDDTMDTELDRTAADFDVNAPEHRAYPGAMGKVKHVWETLDKLGRVSEVWGKLAGFQYLKDQTGRDIREIAHVTRTRIGTPDIKRVGAWQAVTNNLFMFSNVGKEGLRAAVESARENPGAYAWKTVWVNMVPKFLVAGLGSGVIYKLLASKDDPEDSDHAVARTAKQLQRVIAGISEYDKSMYTIVPLYLNEEGKSVYLRIPNDYEGQFFGALAHKMAISQKFTGHDGVLNLVAEQVPYSFNPAITAVADLFTYYVKGQNPVDDFRGRTVIPERAFKAGGDVAHEAMGKATWKTLGGSVLYTPAYDELSVDRTAFEAALRMPVGNVLGAFLKISDQGIKERIDREIAVIEKRKAREGIVRTRGLIRMMNGETISLDELVAIAQQPGGARKRQIMGLLSRQCGNAYVSEFLRAKTDEERLAVVSVMVEDNFVVKGE